MVTKHTRTFNAIYRHLSNIRVDQSDEYGTLIDDAVLTCARDCNAGGAHDLKRAQDLTDTCRVLLAAGANIDAAGRSNRSPPLLSALERVQDAAACRAPPFRKLVELLHAATRSLPHVTAIPPSMLLDAASLDLQKLMQQAQQLTSALAPWEPADGSGYHGRSSSSRGGTSRVRGAAFADARSAAQEMRKSLMRAGVAVAGGSSGRGGSGGGLLIIIIASDKSKRSDGMLQLLTDAVADSTPYRLHQRLAALLVAARRHDLSWDQVAELLLPVAPHDQHLVLLNDVWRDTVDKHVEKSNEAKRAWQKRQRERAERAAAAAASPAGSGSSRGSSGKEEKQEEEPEPPPGLGKFSDATSTAIFLQYQQHPEHLGLYCILEDSPQMLNEISGACCNYCYSADDDSGYDDQCASEIIDVTAEVLSRGLACAAEFAEAALQRVRAWQLCLADKSVSCGGSSSVSGSSKGGSKRSQAAASAHSRALAESRLLQLTKAQLQLSSLVVTATVTWSDKLVSRLVPETPLLTYSDVLERQLQQLHAAGGSRQQQGLAHLRELKQKDKNARQLVTALDERSRAHMQPLVRLLDCDFDSAQQRGAMHTLSRLVMWMTDTEGVAAADKHWRRSSSSGGGGCSGGDDASALRKRLGPDIFNALSSSPGCLKGVSNLVGHLSGRLSAAAAGNGVAAAATSAAPAGPAGGGSGVSQLPLVHRVLNACLEDGGSAARGSAEALSVLVHSLDVSILDALQMKGRGQDLLQAFGCCPGYVANRIAASSRAVAAGRCSEAEAELDLRQSLRSLLVTPLLLQRSQAPAAAGGSADHCPAPAAIINSDECDASGGTDTAAAAQRAAAVAPPPAAQLAAAAAAAPAAPAAVSSSAAPTPAAGPPPEPQPDSLSTSADACWLLGLVVAGAVKCFRGLVAADKAFDALDCALEATRSSALTPAVQQLLSSLMPVLSQQDELRQLLQQQTLLLRGGGAAGQQQMERTIADLAVLMELSEILMNRFLSPVDLEKDALQLHMDDLMYDLHALGGGFY